MEILIGMPGPFELAIIGAIAFLIFGSKLPSMARHLGKAIPSFKKGLAEATLETKEIERDMAQLDDEIRREHHLAIGSREDAKA